MVTGKKETKKPYTVRLPESLFVEIKSEQEITGVVLNDLFVRCIEIGFRQITQPRLEKDGPQNKDKDEPYKIEIPQDVIELAKNAVAGIDADMPAIIRHWTIQGCKISHALESGMTQFANNVTPTPALNGKTAPTPPTTQTPSESSEPTESSKVGIVQRIKDRMQR